ncbi:hypothetical protein GCM10027589_50170 [Actinocorallia lasiicapitis]
MSSSDSAPAATTVKVLVYSDDAHTRETVRLALGRRPAADLPLVEYVEVATQPAIVRLLDAGGIDLAILDGEAQPAGGLGVIRQAKDEVYDAPPMLAIIARKDDQWLANWSRADAVVTQPIDPMELARAAASLLRERLQSRLPVL